MLGYRAHRLIEAKVASETDLGAIWGAFWGHVGPQIGNHWAQVAIGSDEK